MIYREYAEIGGFSGPTIILRKHDYETLNTMSGGAKSPFNEQSLWLEFRYGGVCASNSNGVALVSHGQEERDWSDCEFLPMPVSDLKRVLASIKGKDADKKTIVGCLAFTKTGPKTVTVCGVIAEDYKEESFEGDDDALPGKLSLHATYTTLGDDPWCPWECFEATKYWHATSSPGFTIDSAIAKTLTKAATATKGGPMKCMGPKFAPGSKPTEDSVVRFKVLSEKGDGSTWDVLQGTLRPFART